MAGTIRISILIVVAIGVASMGAAASAQNQPAVDLSPAPAVDAELVVAASLDLTFDLAAAANGGRVVLVPSNGRRKARLIDGNLKDGWKPAARFDPASPLAIVLELGGGETSIDRVVIRPGMFQGRRTPDLIEVAVSTAGPDAGFESVGRFRLGNQPAPQLVSFPPRLARFVRLTILSIHSPGRPGKPAIGEIIVLAADAPEVPAGPIAAREGAAPAETGPTAPKQRESFNIALADHLAEVTTGEGGINPIDGSVADRDYHAVAPLGEPITVRFIQPYTVHRLRVRFFDHDKRVYDYRLEGSLDGETWQPVNEGKSVVGQWQDIGLPPTPMEYVRIVATGMNLEGDPNLRLLELEAYTRDPAPDLAHNLVFAGNGGEVVAVRGGGQELSIDDAFSLIDGGRSARYAWSSKSGDPVPVHDLVVKFFDGRAAPVSAAVLFPVAGETAPRTVEVWTSLTSPDDGFEKAGTYTFENTGRPMLMTFPAVEARYVRFRLVETHGGDHFRVAEVGVYTPRAEGGARAQAAFVAWPDPGDMLARPIISKKGLLYYLNGGWIERTGPGIVGNADGVNDGEVSAYGDLGVLQFEELPAEFVVGLLDEALIEQVRLHTFQFPFISRVTIAASLDGPDGPFQPVEGPFLLPPMPGSDFLDRYWHTIRFPPLRARYLKIGVDTPFVGNSSPGFAEVQVIESQQPGYVPMMERIRRRDFAHGPNIAADALGGSVVSAPAGGPEDWPPENLIDGIVSESAGAWSTGESPDAPLDLVFAFRDKELARVVGVGLDPTAKTESSALLDTAFHGDIGDRPYEFEVWVTANEDPTGWTQIGGTYRLANLKSLQKFAFATAVEARFIKIRLLSNYRGKRFHLGEIQVYEAVEDETYVSILSDRRIDIADFRLGGHIARFSAHRPDRPISNLIDGGVRSGGWASLKGQTTARIVFGFRDGNEALIRHIVLDPATAEPPETAPAEFSVWASRESPVAGFHRLPIGGQGIARLRAGGGPQEFTLDAATPARFVELRIHSSQGADYVSLGEVKIFEDATADATALLRHDPATHAAADTDTVDCTAVACETESNDDAETADRLQSAQAMHAGIARGETDVFAFRGEGADFDTLRLDIEGEPRVGIALTAENASGTIVGSFDPGGLARKSASLNWRVPEGDYLFRVTQPPNVVALVFDNSASMAGNEEFLKEALKGYVRAADESEEILLIGFSDSVEVLHVEEAEDSIGAKCGGAESARRKCILEHLVDAHVQPDRGTSLFEAVRKALEELENVAGRRAIILMTDGQNSDREAPYREMWADIERNPIPIYTIGLGSSLREFRAEGTYDVGSTGADLLRNIALATGARAQFTVTPESLSDLFLVVRSEISKESRYTIRASAAQGFGTIAVSSPSERILTPSPAAIEFIFDLSGSMARTTRDGRSRLDVAKAVLTDLAGVIPRGTLVGLRLFGYDPGREPGCVATRQEIPISAAGAEGLLRTIPTFEHGGARSNTPIGLALSEVPGDFSAIAGPHKIILITDGEDDCFDGTDDPFYPPAVVRRLQDQGFAFAMDIVGFEIDNERADKLFLDLVGLTEGQYYRADDSNKLKESIRDALSAGFGVYDDAGTMVAEGKVDGGSVQVRPGNYVVRVHAAAGDISLRAEVRRDDLTSIQVLPEDGGHLGATVDN